MNLRRAFFAVFVSFLLVVVRPAFAAPASDETVARIHCLGLKQVGSDTNSAQFMKVWQLPQTATLVAQTLDKLSRYPGHGATNAASANLRPLLDDLIASEFYLELSAPTNSALRTSQLAEVGSANSALRPPPSALLLAVRLPADRAGLWQTNLAAASAALAGSGTSHRIECSRVGDWTLVGVDQDKPVAKTVFAARLSLPSLSAAHDWLDADFTPSLLASSLSAGGEGRGEVGHFWSLVTRHSSLSHVYLTLSGESGNVLTRATVDFSRPLETPLPDWQIPTNFFPATFTSFTAVRGLAAWLADLPAWQQLQLSPPPDQAYVWSQPIDPFHTFLAAPLPSASNQVSQLAVRLVQNANPWLATNGQSSFQWQAGLPGIAWNDLVFLTPTLKCVVTNHRDYVVGGLAYFTGGDNPGVVPTGFQQLMLANPNLVYYHAEHTGTRVEDGLFITQLFRVGFNKPQLPARAAGTLWLKNVEPLLGDSSTMVTQTGPRQLALARESTIGFTAPELHLLADWLESPQFPHGLHTFLAPPEKTP